MLRKPRGRRCGFERLWGPIAILLLGATTPPRARAAPGDPWFARDKALHYGVSAGLAATGYGATALLFPAPATREPHRLLVGGVFALGAGVAKEIADRYTGGDPSWRDLTWDVAGTVSGLAVAWLIDRVLD